MSKIIVKDLAGPSSSSNKIYIASGSELDIANSSGTINLAVDAGDIASGTLGAARLPATGVSASSLTTGDLPTARLDQNIRVSAWVVWNQTGTQAITDSFNISSIADGGTGISTLTFTTAMPNANYVTTHVDNYNLGGWEGTCTTTTFAWVSHDGSGYRDYSKCSAAVIGGS